MPVNAAVSEKQYLAKIKKCIKNKNKKDLNIYSRRFFKSYPRSRYTPYVHMILAENESSPGNAIKKYKFIINKFKRYRRNDFAQYRLCQILYLSSKWKDLRSESLKGLRLFTKSRYKKKFRFFLVKAALHSGKLNEAEKHCMILIDNNHDYDSLTRAMILLSAINKKKSGYSRQYIYNLREIVLGFNKSDTRPSTIYLLGEFYEKKGSYNKAYSAYIDIVQKFPKSPEAFMAKKSIKGIIKHNPRRVLYVPGKKIIKNTESYDIKPEIDISEDKKISKSFYSISIGPLMSLKKTNSFKRLLKEFNYLKTVRMKKGYMIYVDKQGSAESALKSKIRLAEEFGINGNIVRITQNNNRNYIYGE